MTQRGNSITLTGIADEAAHDMASQIAVHKELGWDAIEVRLVDGKNIAGALPEEEFKRAAGQLEEAGMRVTSFASAIGNWSRHIKDDFEEDLKELRTAIPRMQRLGTKFIRTMSWLGEGVEEGTWKKETIRRYRELAKLAEDGGICLAHENCTGWGGLGAENMRELVETVGSRHLRLLFDIGNTVSHGYDAWTFYEGVKDFARYIHVKDAKANTEGGPSEKFRYPGEGDAKVREVLSDLLQNGYEGVIAIEPHVASIVHLAGQKPDPSEMRESYLKYARMFISMVEEIQESLQNPRRSM